VFKNDFPLLEFPLILKKFFQIFYLTVKRKQSIQYIPKHAM